MFNIITADIDETPFLDEDPADYVVRLARAKARAITSKVRPGAIVVAADTTVADQGKILGKPESVQAAYDMLQSLRGRVHQVHTGIAIFDVNQDKLLTDCATTDVPMRDYSDEEIDKYIATGDPFDKAGSYAIQHPGFHPVENLSGCYANVVGLPLCHLTRTFDQMGVLPKSDIPTACQRELGYTCPIYQQVLQGEL